MATIRGFLSGVLACFIVQGTQAHNILTVYQAASDNDPIFKQAAANWESAKANLPLARSAYLTHAAIDGSYVFQYQHVHGIEDFPVLASGQNKEFAFSLDLTQPLFNLPAWYAVKSASALVKSATATYSDAAQDLIQRTVSAYVGVLKAQAALDYAKQYQRAVNEEYAITQKKLHVGTVARVAYYQARAASHQANAAVIADRSLLNQAVESLSELTGHHYHALNDLKASMPLSLPAPNRISDWVETAKKQNYGLMAVTYAMVSAQEAIKMHRLGYLPQINATASLSHQYQTDLPGVPALQINSTRAGLAMHFPLLQGGTVLAETRQARAAYLASTWERLGVYRAVISQTRQSFLDIQAGVSKVRADHASLVSAEKAFKATQSAYRVGEQTISDVLADLATVYEAKKDYANDQYQYLIDHIKLKYFSGMLSPHDLEMIHHLLTRPVTLDLPQVAYSNATGDVMLSQPVVASHRSPVDLPAPESTRLDQPAALPAPAQTQRETIPQENALSPKSQLGSDEDHRVIVLAERHAGGS